MQSSNIVIPTAIETPFALNGDKNIPAQNASGTDTSSIDEGFLPITQVDLNAGGSAPERKDFNGMFYLATDQKVYLQNGGLITFNQDVSDAIGGYPKGAILSCLSNGTLSFVESLKENNAENFITDPTKINNTDWKYTTIVAADSTANGSVLTLKNRDSYLIQLGDGTLIQWGLSSTTNHSKTVSLYAPYTSTYRTYLTDYGDTTSIATFKVRTQSSSYFTVYSSTSSSGDSFHWFTIGR